MNLNKFWEWLLDCIFPRKNLDQILGHKNLKILETKNAIDVSQNYDNIKFGYSKIVVATDYQLIKPVIYNFKYLHQRYLGQSLGQILTQKILSSISLGQLDRADLITFVPPDPKRVKIRGFNSPQILADYLSKVLNIELISIFEKSKHTKAQAGLSKIERVQNLDNVFNLIAKLQILEKLSKAKTIYLIDDVIASGQTISKLNKILFESYPKLKIINIALARNDEEQS